MLPRLRRLHRIEELLLDDLSILNRIETCFIQRHAFPRVFRRDVILEMQDETVAVGIGPFNRAVVDLVIVDPPLILFLDLRDSFLGLFHARHGTGLDALDIRRVKAIDRLLIFALPAQCCHFFPDVYGCHDEILLGEWGNVIALSFLCNHYQFLQPLP